MWGKTPEPKPSSPTPKTPEPIASAPKPPALQVSTAAPSPVVATPSNPLPSPSFDSVGSRVSENSSRIGAGLKVHGVISGNSDLIVEGETNGKIYLSGARVTVAKTGRVQADIEGLEIVVEGQVQGNLKATDRIRLGSTSNVQGTLVTPRFAIEDGARVRGKVEMLRAGDVKLAETPKADKSTPKVIEPKPAESKIAEAKLADTKPETSITPAAEIPNVRATAARTQGD
jgi:cytoskeletal protein CcmA (bactofilin family)